MRALLATIVAATTLAATTAQAQYVTRWQRLGGTWSSGWNVSSTPSCPHLDGGCRGPGGNYCGWYPANSVALWWRDGPYSQPWQIICKVRPG